MSSVANIAVSLLPIVAFLLSLLFLDSFKLVNPRQVAAAITVGCLTAITAMFANPVLLDLMSVDTITFSRYVAPVIEEVLKALYIVAMLRLNRIGFMVDAAVIGFAVGTGFALVENVYYLAVVPDGNLLVWTLRGFGTAAMHGGATAMFAILSKHFIDRSVLPAFIAFLPGLAVSVVTHSVFNHFVLPPILTSITLIVAFSGLLLVVFERSEKATRDWLGKGLDADMEAWSMLSSGQVSDSRIGKYLESLHDHFAPEVVADMFCYLQLHIELGIQAKGLLLAREAGARLSPDDGLSAKLQELKYLEKSLGTAGYLTIKPFVHNSQKSIWQLRLLER